MDSLAIGCVLAEAMRTLIQRLMQALSPLWIAYTDLIIFLPPIFIVLERLSDHRIDVGNRALRQILLGEQQAVIGFNAATPVLQIPYGTTQIMAVHVEHDYRHPKELRHFSQ